jgi:hypothetical protein
MSFEIREPPFGKSSGQAAANGDFQYYFEVFKDAIISYAVFTNSNTSYPIERYPAFLGSMEKR